ncbi:MAG: low temperature requirement protein A [Sphingomonadaceae bacterium]|nr:low temperature requirement protein A [Sphingomonadaceae bacterium]
MSEVEGRFFDFRPFGPRDPDEVHRAATPLELFFDLVTVIAIASAAVGLHHGIAENHAAQAIPVFLVAFTAIWWAWMNYTWYASAYDNDGPLYRLLTFWIMGGALLLAASVPRFFDGMDLRLPVLAFVIMRVGMIALWVIAARHDSAHAASARRYAIGIALAQVFWIVIVALAPPQSPLLFALIGLGFLAEFMVPVWAERVSPTPWHAEHIVERYGLLMIIMLGEILLAGSIAFARAGDAITLASPLVQIAVAALITAFSMWWLYFARNDHHRVHMQDRQLAFTWGYGHVIPFCSAAAVGAAIAVLVDIVTGHADISLRAGQWAIAVPLAAYMAGLWVIRDRFVLEGATRHILLLFAALVLATGLLPNGGLVALPVLALASVWARSMLATRQRRRERADAGD